MAKTTHNGHAAATTPTRETPTPRPAPPPQPATMAVLKVLQNLYDTWIAAGGTPPIYGPVPPSQSIPAGPF